MIAPLLARARAVVLPWWAKWAALAVLLLVVYGAGRVHEARRGADAMLDHLAAQAKAGQRIERAQAKVVTVTETVYRDRIKKIYIQGATIETNIPTYIQPADTERFAVNAGFIRVLDAAWTGEAVGPARDSDREPAGIPIDGIAANETANATSCRVWRKQALGWREFYAGQQKAVNGKVGEWAIGASVAD